MQRVVRGALRSGRPAGVGEVREIVGCNWLLENGALLVSGRRLNASEARSGSRRDQPWLGSKMTITSGEVATRRFSQSESSQMRSPPILALKQCYPPASKARTLSTTESLVAEKISVGPRCVRRRRDSGEGNVEQTTREIMRNDVNPRPSSGVPGERKPGRGAR